MRENCEAEKARMFALKDPVANGNDEHIEQIAERLARFMSRREEA